MHDVFYPERSMLLLPMKRELSMGIKGQYGSVDRRFWFIKVQKCAHSRGTTVHTITLFHYHFWTKQNVSICYQM